jgi:glycine dehydrogenase subunit 1
MMSDKNPIVYPYIPNSEPSVKQQMLTTVDAKNADEFYEDVPESIRFRGELNLPEPFLSEFGLKKHVEGILARNITAKEYLNFKGGGCYQHYVPSICDEINRRSEFLTAYAGEPYDDHGRFQALFEYTSMMGELLDMDVVNVPTYDGFQASATSLRMACRITGRNQVLISSTTGKDKLSKIREYLKPDIEIKMIGYHRETGQLALDELNEQVSEQIAAVYFENPAYLGYVEINGDEIGRISHSQGSLLVVSVDPISLGVLKPPANYGADIVCGDIQPLGMHMNFGGGHAGFIATHDEEKFVMEYPSRLFGIAPTIVPGEYGFGDVAYERTSFAVREEGKEWVGTAAALWGITAGVYLALMGPQGMQEIGAGIMARARYAMKNLSQITGVHIPFYNSAHFKEFAVNFDATGKTVQNINQGLLERGIFGGVDISNQFPQLGQSALFCVTEMHTKQDIDTLVRSLTEVIES